MNQENKLKIEKEAGKGPLKKLTFVRLLYLVTEDNDEHLEKSFLRSGCVNMDTFSNPYHPRQGDRQLTGGKVVSSRLSLSK